MPPEGVDASRLKIEPSNVVQALLDDTEPGSALHRRLALFHGRWDLLDDPSHDEAARMALASYQFDHPLLDDETISVRDRAEAAFRRGDAEQTVALLRHGDDIRSRVLRAEALDQLGRRAEALNGLADIDVAPDETASAATMTALGRVIVMRATFEGRPARDYHAAMDLFAAARDRADRLYWPAYLAEAELLVRKDNMPEAAAALEAALTLNPRCSRAWYLLGGMAVKRFDFAVARQCVEQLRQINPHHLLGDLLEVRLFLTQRDPASAHPILARITGAWPKQRMGIALTAAAFALQHDFEACERALRRHDALSPGSARAYQVVGSHLSATRQYAASDTMLREAVDRDPNWPEPLTDRGLMLLQWGHEEEARRVLTRACNLDPFQVRAVNSLKMVEALTTYHTIRTPHFVIKFGDPRDAVLARDMARHVEDIYDNVTTIFDHRPSKPTLIEIMPDKQWFAVRITGMPSIWTFAACTGDIIAITPPKYGKHQHGPFDWTDVVRHEFVHTVTLDQTANRIPHWFTEACAVSTQRTRRDFDTCRLLAAALQADELFALDQINWAFVRPQRPTDRGLAYAQSDWMVEFIVEQFGHAAIIALLNTYRAGTSDEVAMEQVTGLAPEAFLARFESWAAQQVQRWGLAPHPDDDAVFAAVAASEERAVPELIRNHPNHPAVMKMVASVALAANDTDTARQAVLRYAEACPVDPWPSRALARLALADGRTAEALGPLQRLDSLALNETHWAVELARLHRADGRFSAASAAMARALHREPYNAGLRETAAAIALQAGDGQEALFHITSLTLLEPRRSIHWVRLAAIRHRLGDLDAAHRAATKARQIDPATPVQRFMKSSAGKGFQGNGMSE